MVRNCDEQLEAAIAELTALDQQLSAGAVADQNGARHRREQLVEIIKQTVALTEFTRLLQSVPPESVAAVQEFRSQLDVFLPQTASDELLEQAFERRSETRIVPTSFQE